MTKTKKQSLVCVLSIFFFASYSNGNCLENRSSQLQNQSGQKEDDKSKSADKAAFHAAINETDPIKRKTALKQFLDEYPSSELNKFGFQGIIMTLIETNADKELDQFLSPEFNRLEQNKTDQNLAAEAFKEKIGPFLKVFQFKHDLKDLVRISAINNRDDGKIQEQFNKIRKRTDIPDNCEFAIERKDKQLNFTVVFKIPVNFPDYQHELVVKERYAFEITD